MFFSWKVNGFITPFSIDNTFAKVNISLCIYETYYVKRIRAVDKIVSNQVKREMTQNVRIGVYLK